MSQDESSSLQPPSERDSRDSEWRAMLDGDSMTAASHAPNVTVSSATPPVPTSSPVYATPPATPPSDALASPGRTPTVADADPNATLKDSNKRARTQSSQSQAPSADPGRFDNLTEYMRRLHAFSLSKAAAAASGAGSETRRSLDGSTSSEMGDSDECDSMWSSQSVRGSPAPVARRTFAAAAAASGSSVELELHEAKESAPPASSGSAPTKAGASDSEARITLEEPQDYFSFGYIKRPNETPQHSRSAAGEIEGESA